MGGCDGRTAVSNGLRELKHAVRNRTAVPHAAPPELHRKEIPHLVASGRTRCVLDGREFAMDRTGPYTPSTIRHQIWSKVVSTYEDARMAARNDSSTLMLWAQAARASLRLQGDRACSWIDRPVSSALVGLLYGRSLLFEL